MGKLTKRKRIHLRIRKKVKGTAARPRLNVFRSNNHIYCQLIDDRKGVTLVGASSKEISDKGTRSEIATKVGEMIAERALAKNIKASVFDRGGYLYHGRVKALAEGAREKGLHF